MINNYYTLRALVEEWRALLPGTRLEDAFSQEPDELTLAFTGPDGDQMIRVGTRPPMQFMFRSDGYSKARRNVATLFEQAFDRTVAAVEMADRDRLVFVRLSGGMELRIPLFGPHANVLVVSEGRVEAAFRDDVRLTGTEPPGPRPAPSPDTLAAFTERWRTNRKTVAQALSSACPLFDRTLGAEAASRAGLDPDAAPGLGDEALSALFAAAEGVRNDLLEPRPRIYWDGKDPALFSLIALEHVEDFSEERFASVDAAARVFIRRRLGRRRFRDLYDPIEEALEDAAAHYRKSADRMLEELARESRADQYEKWGHLLMAKAGAIPPGAEEVELEDLFEEGSRIRVPLDPALSAVENAQKYYDRARRTRRSREEAENRLVETGERAEEAERLLAALRTVDELREIRSFRKDRADELARYMPAETSPSDRVPFRRFDLPGGYEVWVGRNARQNDDLTFRHAQKYDLWMHARGVAGSHTVLRLPNRDAEPDRRIVRQAAAIAAHYSKARGSALVPVMVTERKYVRKPKGAGPGAVMVDREDVVLVEPGLPDGRR